MIDSNSCRGHQAGSGLTRSLEEPPHFEKFAEAENKLTPKAHIPTTNGLTTSNLMFSVPK
jgi:hypothetical protein